MTRESLEELIGVVTQHAPKMRAAGIAVFASSDVTIHLLPHEAEASAATDDDESDEEDDDNDPLFDPATFGRKRGRVPGKQRGEK